MNPAHNLTLTSMTLPVSQTIFHILNKTFKLTEYKDAYSNLSKSTLVQESAIFKEKSLKEKKCIDLLNKVIFVLNQGQHFAENEKS